MTALLLSSVAYAVATVVCLLFALCVARRDLAAERVRVADLLTRLASRTPAEYVAVAQMQTPPFPSEDETWLYDPSGLIGVIDDGEGE